MRPGRQLGERLAEIGKGDPAAAREGEERRIAEPAPQPRGRRRRQASQAGYEGREGADDDFLRSRTISKAIGMTDSTITMATTRWM